MHHEAHVISSTSSRRTRRSRFFTLAVSIGLVAGGAIVAAQPAGAAAVWSLTSSPNPSGSISTVLAGVACPTTKSCFAVGRYSVSGGTKTLVEHWNGGSWSIESSPNPSGGSANLSGIACPSTKSCFAVGSYIPAGSSSQFTLVEHWNGANWGFLNSANPGGATDASLTDVACPNLKGCFAVGSFSNAGSTGTLVEHWNGSSWSIQSSPTPSGTSANLRDIECPTTKSCFAVGTVSNGSGSKALAEHYNGSGWGILGAATPGGSTSASLTGISCPSPKSCFAVGTFSAGSGAKTLAEHWNGSTWSAEGSVNPSSSASLNSVACPNTKSCFAVGSSTVKDMVEHWNGSNWGQMGMPSPPVVARTNAVACPSARICFAVGALTKTSTSESFALRYR
jgi:hypothetical protein